MDDMIERIAGIIDPNAWDNPPQSKLWANRREVARGKARAVLAVMREPSEAMKLAGCDTLISNKRKSWAMAAGDAYTAMIDAASAPRDGEKP